METKYPDILTLENFWNELQQKHPAAMKVFCDWIDEYKKRVDWKRLFSDGVREYQFVKGKPKHIVAPKFHEIPVAMQIGIFFQFTSEQVEKGGPRLFWARVDEARVTNMTDFIDCIKMWFEEQ